jgi:hypothetical protein
VVEFVFLEYEFCLVLEGRVTALVVRVVDLESEREVALLRDEDLVFDRVLTLLRVAAFKTLRLLRLLEFL